MTSKGHAEGRKGKIKVLLVDDHPIVRQGLAELIRQEIDMVVCGDAEDAPGALKAIAELNPDIVVADLTLRETSGLDLIKDVRIRHPQLPVLVLSMHDEAFYAERALRAGARGYVMKEDATEKVLTAIRRIVRGEIYLSDKIASRMLDKLVRGTTQSAEFPVQQLSDRELEVFELIGQGQGTRQIAERLHLSTKTIESHRENIKRKLKLENAVELLQQAIQWVQSERPS